MRNSITTAATQPRRRGGSLRADGLRSVRLWLPDTRSAAYRQKCERESQSLTGDPNEAETLARIANVADTRGWK